MNIIKNTIYLGAIALIVTSFSHIAFAENHHDKKTEAHDHDNMPSMNEMGVMGTGVLNKIMLEDKKINITHEAIPDLKWPAMTMDLNVTDDVDLNAFSKNENVKFHIKLGKDKVYRVTKIMKIDEHSNDNHHD